MWHAFKLCTWTFHRYMIILNMILDTCASECHYLTILLTHFSYNPLTYQSALQPAVKQCKEASCKLVFDLPVAKITGQLTKKNWQNNGEQVSDRYRVLILLCRSFNLYSDSGHLQYCNSWLRKTHTSQKSYFPKSEPQINAFWQAINHVKGNVRKTFWHKQTKVQE